ncbi:hypothetical protein ACH5RR_003887 [Cinchona calisaya]|uniref:SWIM-type domain-containing protein n=1 Tax=Cinchona calisaya TaxID=153742 RepID=A0ABD3AW66_9GENT
MEVERTVANSPAVFHRLFIMLDTQRRGFISGCRPVIGLDACHLKGPYGGQLMHALGSDGNNQMYPIAMAVVEAECNDSWMWFLKLMIEVIGRPEDMGWVFISDRQKGLVETFNTLMPRAEHRFRVRHLIMKQIEEMKFHARNFEPTLAGEGIFEVMMGVSNFIVDIERKTCSCRKYDLTGILCVHAVAVLMHSKLILKTMCTGNTTLSDDGNNLSKKNLSRLSYFDSHSMLVENTSSDGGVSCNVFTSTEIYGAEDSLA